MEWQFVVALVLIVPIIFFPVMFIWFLNMGGIYAWVRTALRERKATREEAQVGGTGRTS